MEATRNGEKASSDPDPLHESSAEDDSVHIREYFDLRDALAEPGCPVCARVLHAGREVLTAVMAEPTSPAAARKSVQSFRGLCNTHAWRIHQLQQRPVSFAEAYEFLLRGRIETLKRTIGRRPNAPRRRWWEWVWGRGALASNPWWVRRRRCPACRSAEAVEHRDLDLLLDLITDMEFARAFEGSAGLCLPHLGLIQRLAPDHPNLPRLLEAHIPKVKNLHAELQDYIRRAKAPILTLTQEEENALWGRMLEWTAGKPGVFVPERDVAPAADTRGTILGGGGRAGVRSGSRPGPGESDAGRMDEGERLSLENAKLQRRLVEVSRKWAEESARRAALQFQVHKLSEDVKVLELNLAGARGEAKSGEIQAQRLREEIQALRGEIRRHRGEREGPPDPPKEAR